MYTYDMSRNLHKVNMTNIMINFISYCFKIRCFLIFNVTLEYLNNTVQKKWEGWLNNPKIWYLLTLMVHLGKKTSIYCKCVCVCVCARTCVYTHANMHATWKYTSLTNRLKMGHGWIWLKFMSAGRIGH